MRYLKRILLLPIGLAKGLLKIANENARDIENKRRFPYAIIDQGSSFTEDTTIGKHSHTLPNCIINHGHIGNYSYVGRNSIIQNTTIGNYCSIANDVFIGLGSHPIENFTTSPLFYRKKNTFNIELMEEDLDFEEYGKILIENDVWIGARAIILDGVTIGNGAIIAANSVVTKDVPPYAIVGGVPAKEIKYRFNESKIEKLLASEWWNIDLQKIKQDIMSLNEL